MFWFVFFLFFLSTFSFFSTSLRLLLCFTFSSAKSNYLSVSVSVSGCDTQIHHRSWAGAQMIFCRVKSVNSKRKGWHGNLENWRVCLHECLWQREWEEEGKKRCVMFKHVLLVIFEKKTLYIVRRAKHRFCCSHIFSPLPLSLSLFLLCIIHSFTQQRCFWQ